MKTSEANKLMKEWQKRLSMQDWRIVLHIDCEPDDMYVEDSSGSVSWQESTKTACINILDPKYYGQRVVPYDFEKTLVHELLHLKFCMMYKRDGSLRERLVHTLIDDISRALVDAKRTKWPEAEPACK